MKPGEVLRADGLSTSSGFCILSAPGLQLDNVFSS